MDGNFFFVIGGLLVLAAVVISFVGIRGSDSFPPNRGVLLGVTAAWSAPVPRPRASSTATRSVPVASCGWKSFTGGCWSASRGDVACRDG